MRKIEKLLRAKMEATLEGQNLLMTHGSWADGGNWTYVPATYAFITEDWEIITISPHHTKHAGKQPKKTLVNSSKG